MCALNDDVLRKVQKAALKGRSGLPPARMDEVSRINAGDIFFATDGGISGCPPLIIIAMFVRQHCGGIVYTLLDSYMP